MSLDVADARRFLSTLYSEDIEMGEPLAQGEWSRAYAFRHQGQELVVRFNPERDAFDRDVFAERFRSTDVPIPHVLAVGAAPHGFFAVSERAFGDFLEELEPDRFRAMLPALFRMLGTLQTADTSRTSGLGPWTTDGNGRYASWHDYLLDVEARVPAGERERWRSVLDSSDLGSEAFRQGVAAVRDLAPACPELRQLVHSDLINRNVLVDGDVITAVIDWQCAMYGDHLYDLAWITFWSPWHPGVAAANLGTCAIGPDAQLRMRCYEIHVGVRHLIYNAWRRDGGPELEAVARRTLETLERGVDT